METCPKCRFALEPGAAECPACGVILAKLRTTPPPSRPSPALPVDGSALPALRLPPEPGVPPANPYASPQAPLDTSPAAPTPPGEVITQRTVELLTASEQWVVWVGYCGFFVTFVLLLASLVLFMSDFLVDQILAAAYVLSAGIGVAILVPLQRSARILGRFRTDRAGSCLESYAAEQAKVWQRTALAFGVTFFILVVGIAIVAFTQGLLELVQYVGWRKPVKRGSYA